MKMEAEAGIEPASADLQSDAWPLCYPAISFRFAMIAKFFKSARTFFSHLSDVMKDGEGYLSANLAVKHFQWMLSRRKIG